MRHLILCVVLFTAPALAGPRVVVSVLPLAGIVDAVSCGTAEVHVLVPPAANPASWVPTLRDREAVQAADLLVRVGHAALAFERRWLGDLAADRDDMRPIEAASGLDLLPDDPHVWTSPAALEHMARVVAGALAPWDASACLADYVAVIEAARDEMAGRLTAFAGRRFYVFHPAWGYFARDFGLIQAPIEREGKEPGPAYLARLIDQARSDGARVILVQPQFSDAAARAVAEAIGADIAAVDPLARDTLASLRQLTALLVQTWSGETP